MGWQCVFAVLLLLTCVPRHANLAAQPISVHMHHFEPRARLRGLTCELWPRDKEGERADALFRAVVANPCGAVHDPWTIGPRAQRAHLKARINLLVDQRVSRRVATVKDGKRVEVHRLVVAQR